MGLHPNQLVLYATPTPTFPLLTHPQPHQKAIDVKFFFFLLVSLIFRKPLFNRMDVWTVFWCVGITGDIMLFFQIHSSDNTVLLFSLVIIEVFFLLPYCFQLT